MSRRATVRSPMNSTVRAIARAGAGAGRWALALAALGLLVDGTARGDEPGRVELRGSRAMAPLAEFVAERFMADHPAVVVPFVGTSMTHGFRSLVFGTCDAVLATDDVPEEMTKLAADRGVRWKRTDVYRDAIVPIVDPSNPVGNLTLAQLRDIFRGAIKNWKEVGGPDLPIVVATHSAASAAYDTWKRRVLGHDAVVTPTAKPATFHDALVSDKAAIGYISDERAKPYKVLTVDGKAASPQAVVSGEYPIIRQLSIYRRTDAPPLVEQVVSYFVDPERGAKFVREHGDVPNAPAPAPAPAATVTP